MVSKKNKVKIGIIGTGNIARAHLMASYNIETAEVVGVYDIDFKKAKSFCCDIFAYKDIDQLIDVVDAVIIAAPNHVHADYAIRAIKKGKHVLCEKPLAISDIEANYVCNEADKNNVVCNVGFNYRFLNIFQVLKELLNNNEFGDILSFDIEFKKNSALRRKTHTWRDGAKSCGTSGALGDLGIHLIDILRFLLGSEFNTNRCVAKIATYVPQKENLTVCVDDYAVVNGVLESGTYFRILTSKVSSPEDVGLNIKIIGSKKEFFYDSNIKNEYKLKESASWETRQFAFEGLQDPATEFFGWAQSFVTQLDNWIQIICHKKTTDNASFYDGYLAQRALTDFLRKNISADYVGYKNL